MSAKHTPGPWITSLHFAARHGARSYVPVLRPGSDPVPVAVVHLSVDGYGHDEGAANARLVAFAPDLLAVARSTAEHFADTDAPLGKRARELIAKVDGGKP